mgnify:CR=1 FL=1
MSDWNKHIRRSTETLNERFNRLNKCVERKSYKDPITGEYCINRCIRRRRFKPIKGKNYIPSTDTSIPWEA